jgi:predicted phosphodiesterase
MIVVCGDFHGRFESVNKFLNSHKEITIILQCGDFGFWPRFKLSKLKNYDTKIFWCDGNHEDFEAIKKIEDVEVFPNVYYMSRGTILTLPDERKVLFMGGAYSIDKYYRTPGYDWFPEETISQKDIMDLPEENLSVIIF